MKKKAVAIMLMTSVMLCSCADKKDIKVREKEEQDETEATTSETTEETDVVAVKPTTKPVATPTPEPVSDEGELTFENNGCKESKDGECAFGNLTKEEAELISEKFCKDPKSAVDLTRLLSTNFEGSEYASMRRVFPHAANKYTPEDSVDYIKVEDLESYTMYYLGLTLDELVYDPLYKVEHDGANCVVVRSEGPDTRIGYTLLGANKDGNDAYAVFEADNGSIAVAHLEFTEDGNVLIRGNRYVDSFEAPVKDYSLPGSFWLSSEEKIDEKKIGSRGLFEMACFKYVLYKDAYMANHGCIFEDPYVQAVMDSRAWYEGSIAEADFDMSVLNDVEKNNYKVLDDIYNGRFLLHNENETYTSEMPERPMEMGMDPMLTAEENLEAYYMDYIVPNVGLEETEEIELEYEAELTLHGAVDYYIHDFDKDGTPEMLAFFFTGDHAEFEKYDWDPNYNVLNAYLCSIDGETIKVTDEMRVKPYGYVGPDYDMGYIHMGNTEFEIDLYKISSGDHDSIVYIFDNAAAPNLANGYTESAWKMTVKDGKFAYEFASSMYGAGSDDLSGADVYFEDGREVGVYDVFGYDDCKYPDNFTIDHFFDDHDIPRSGEDILNISVKENEPYDEGDVKFTVKVDR